MRKTNLCSRLGLLAGILWLLAAPAAVLADGVSALGTCAVPDRAPGLALRMLEKMGSAADCGFNSTNPSAEYDPTNGLLTLQVVIHIIMNDTCTEGVVSDEQVNAQMDILNEDFLAIPGSPGANGTDSQVRFELASEDPLGNPTTGITRDCNTTWYNDDGNYWDSLAWDPHRYVNIYVNTAGGAGGYVPFLPSQGGAAIGANEDRIVINQLGFGPGGPVASRDQGRLATHEVGHYLGLFHPYFGGCGTETAPDCYSSGDTICDTTPDDVSHSGCPIGQTACFGSAIPATNYMELTDDSCKDRFTAEQARRMRCTIEFFRPNLVTASTCGNGVREGSEECDGADLGGAVCGDIGCSTGAVSCAGDCTLDFSACTDCGQCDFNGTCDAGEDCTTCPTDCGSGTASGAICGNGVCEAGDGEDCDNCAQDCDSVSGGPPSGRFCCGGAGEGCGGSGCNSGGFSCTTTPAPPASYCCGDLVCEGAEDSSNCGVDCGTGGCSNPGEACNDNSDCCSLTCKGNGTCK